MAFELTAEHSAIAVRAAAGAAGLLMMLAAWSALHSLDSGPKVLSGTVSVVNAQSTKFCLTPDGEDEWCGRLAMSGGTPVKVGQKVAVIVTSLDTEPDGAMQIATLVPPELSLK